MQAPRLLSSTQSHLVEERQLSSTPVWVYFFSFLFFLPQPFPSLYTEASHCTHKHVDKKVSLISHFTHLPPQPCAQPSRPPPPSPFSTYPSTVPHTRAQDYFHYGLIPAIIIIGMNTTPRPGLTALLTPV